MVDTCLKKNEYVELPFGPQTVAPDRLPNVGRRR